MRCMRLLFNPFPSLRSVWKYRFFSDNNNTISNNNRTQPTPCDPSEIGHPLCGKNQRCRVNDEGATCECQRDFHYVNNECVVIVTSTAASVETTTTLKPEIKPESGGTSWTSERTWRVCRKLPLLNAPSVPRWEKSWPNNPRSADPESSRDSDVCSG